MCIPILYNCNFTKSLNASQHGPRNSYIWSCWNTGTSLKIWWIIVKLNCMVKFIKFNLHSEFRWKLNNFEIWLKVCRFWQQFCGIWKKWITIFLLNFHNLFLLGFKLYVSLILSKIISLGCIIIRMLLDRISPHYENV